MRQKTIGKVIKALRREKKISKKEMADQLNISTKLLSKWESNKDFPNVNELKKLSELLEIPLEELKELINPSGESRTEKEHRKDKQRIILIIIIFVIFMSPFLALAYSYLGKSKYLPSYSSISMKDYSEKLFLALEEYDYKELEILFNSSSKLKIKGQEKKSYTWSELEDNIKQLEADGYRFKEAIYDGAVHGDTIYYKVLVEQGSSSYPLYYSMTYDETDKKYAIMIWDQEHNLNNKIKTAVESVFCPNC